MIGIIDNFGSVFIRHYKTYIRNGGYRPNPWVHFMTLRKMYKDEDFTYLHATVPGISTR